MKPLFLVLAFLCLTQIADAGEPLVISSPDGKIQVQTPAVADVQHAQSTFAVRFQGRPLLSTDLALYVGGSNLLENAVLLASRSRSFDSTYSVLFGKSNPVRDQFKQLTLAFENKRAPV